MRELRLPNVWQNLMFAKTSTGYGPRGASLEDVIAMKVIKYANEDSGMLNKELFIAQRLSYKYPLSFVQFLCIN